MRLLLQIWFFSGRKMVEYWAYDQDVARFKCCRMLAFPPLVFITLSQSLSGVCLNRSLKEVQR